MTYDHKRMSFEERVKEDNELIANIKRQSRTLSREWQDIILAALENIQP